MGDNVMNARRLRDAANEMLTAARRAEAAAAELREIAEVSATWLTDRGAWAEAWQFTAGIALCSALDLEARDVYAFCN